jgi:hypothetical protein
MIDVLINPTWEQVIERDPMVLFSWYLSGRKNVLLMIANEIIENLDEAFANNVVHGGKLDRAESLFWLWTLGAYEVVRTMCQAKSCFSERAFGELARLKTTLSVIRMPAAKMEKPGERLPVTSNRSPAQWDMRNRDLLVGDPTCEPGFSARSVLKRFDMLFASLETNDILAQHEASYS